MEILKPNLLRIRHFRSFTPYIKIHGLDFRFCRRRRDGLTAEHSNFARPPDDRLAICESNGGQEVVRLRVNGDDCEWDEAGGCEGVAAVDASDLCF